MPLFNNRLANEAVAIAGAIAVMVLLDWLLPGGSIILGVRNITWEKIKYIGIGLVVLVIFVIIVGIWVIKRSEKVWKFEQIKDRYWLVLRNKLWSGILSKILNKTTAGKNVWLKRRLEPNRLPAILRENIIILFSLSNYLKRLYIMYRKKGQVASAEEVIQKMYGPIGHRMDIKELGYEIYGLRNGKGPKVTTNSKGQPISWFGGYEEYCKVLDKVADLVKEYIISIQNRREGEWPSFGSRAINLVQEVNGAATNIVEAYNLLRVVGRAYGAHQPIKAWRYLAMDQCNPYGWYEHEYKFVKDGTPLSDGSSSIGELEVNFHREVLKDKYANMDLLFDTIDPHRAPRKVAKDYRQTVYESHEPAAVMGHILQDWTGFINDLRFGQNKFFSKSSSDYVSAMTEKSPEALGRTEFYQEWNIKCNPRVKEMEYPAFDRRALANPGFMTYMGRERYDQSEPQIKFSRKKNPYPALSSRGMGIYIARLTKEDVDDISAASDYQMRFLRDTAVTVQRPSEAKHAIGALGEEIKQEKGA